MRLLPFTLGLVLIMPAVAFSVKNSPASAHQVKLSGSVGGTKHIEPDDNPRAGQVSLTWFALTRKGGESIPLKDCDCQLAVYSQPYQEGDRPIQTPALRAISAEGYKDIPGADIHFPQVGAYTLVLQGKPRQSNSFDPFELEFSVTVAAGQTTPPTPATPLPVEPAIPTPVAQTVTPAATKPEQSGVGWAIAPVVLLLAGAVGFGVWRRNRKY
jgi:hypothetical protein